MAPPLPTRALFVNSGILGQLTFAAFVRRAFAEERDGVRAVQVLVTEGLTPAERVMRRLLCLRLWPGGLPAANLDLHRFRCEINAGLLARRRIKRAWREAGGFDVLHFHRQGTAYASLDLMRRVPAIVSIDSTQRAIMETARYPLELRSYAPNVRRDGRIFRAARLIISTSAWAEACLRDEYPDCQTEIAVMPTPVAPPPGSQDWPAERLARAQVPGSRPQVLFVGGDFPRKGGFDLLRVWREGGFWQRAELHVVSNWLIAPAALPPSVTIHRAVATHSNAWLERWRAADLFVLPTRNEAFGTVYLEAGAAALPAIGTRLAAVPEIVQHEVTGILVPPDDDVALAAALRRLLDNPGLRHTLGLAARRHVVSTADPEQYRRQLAQAIRRVAGHEPCAA